MCTWLAVTPASNEASIAMLRYALGNAAGGGGRNGLDCPDSRLSPVMDLHGGRKQVDIGRGHRRYVRQTHAFEPADRILEARA